MTLSVVGVLRRTVGSEVVWIPIVLTRWSRAVVVVGIASDVRTHD